MKNSFHKEKTLELIQQMKLAKIGQYAKWQKMTGKINQNIKLSPKELEYFTTLTRIYQNGKSSRSKIYHVRLSPEDTKPPCKKCQKESLFYCNINDAYFCSRHIVGHDENEM